MKTIFWVTWWLWVGKSFLCEKLRLISESKWIDFNFIQVDEIRRYILKTSQDSWHFLLRKKFVNELNLQVDNDNFFIDWAILWEKIFFNTSAMNIYRNIINPEIRNILNRKISSVKNWIILVEWAMLIEDEMLSIVNNNLIIVTCDFGRRIERMWVSDLPIEQISKRIKLSDGSFDRIEFTQNIINKDWWNLITVNNSDNHADSFYQNIFTKIINLNEKQNT